MPATRTQPRKMSLTVCMSRWPTTTRCPQFSYSLGPTNSSSTDAPASFACRNNGSRVVAQQQHHPRPGPDAAHPDHLARDVDQPDIGRGAPVGRARGCALYGRASRAALLRRARDPRLVHEVTKRHDERRFRDDPRPSVHDPGEPVERPEVVLRLRLPESARELLATGLAQRPRRPRRYGGLVDVGVPDVQRRLLGERAHRLAVRGDRDQDDLARSFAANPLARAAISRLVASRLTSHSHGPGSVSSKSLMSKTSSAPARRTRRSSPGGRRRRPARDPVRGVVARSSPSAAPRRGRR